MKKLTYFGAQGKMIFRFVIQLASRRDLPFTKKSQVTVTALILTDFFDRINSINN